MKGINFRKVLIKKFIDVSKSFNFSPREVVEDIDSLVEKINIIDREKGQVTKDFVKSVMDLHKFVNKEIEIWVINKKCKNIRNAYKEEDYDAVIVDVIRDSMDDELDIKYIIARLIRVILLSLI